MQFKVSSVCSTDTPHLLKILKMWILHLSEILDLFGSKQAGKNYIVIVLCIIYT